MRDTEHIHDHSREPRYDSRAIRKALMKPDTIPNSESDADRENRYQNKHEIELTELFHKVQPPSDLERLIVGTLEFAEHLFGNAVPEIFPDLRALRAVDVVSQDVVDKVRRHVS